jgi:hypothetical protein
MGDIGGLFDFFRYFFGVLIPVFAHTRMTAILASRLYAWPSDDAEEEKPTAVQIGAENKKMSTTIHVPALLDWQHCFYMVLCCGHRPCKLFGCCKKHRYSTKFKGALDLVDTDM